ncbi:MAG: MFS transporter [SAR324 cluster bacterium]|nr:MFS transporter [SAR324 cluster bacterium]
MERKRTRFIFLNVGHAYDHLFMLLFPTVVLSLEKEFQQPYAELLPLALGGFIAFGAGTLPAGWLGDRWSRRNMMTVFFFGIGAAAVLTGLANSLWQIAAGLTLVGLFAAIYHPVGTAMVVQGRSDIGRALGINGVAGNIGVAAAALTAGALTDLISWRAAFIVPGVIAMATGVAFALAVRDGAENAQAQPKRAAGASGGAVAVNVFVVLAVTTILSGFIFNTSLVALPKLFAVRLTDFTSTTFGVGVIVSLVYLFGAFSQILVGLLLDRFPLKTVLIVVTCLQMPFLLGAAQLENGLLIFVGALMMFTIFGVIPITDTLVARATTESWRSRIYAVKYVGSLGISALAIPAVSLVYGATQEFTLLFMAFAAISLIIAACATLLPRGGFSPAAEPATA